MAVDGAIAAEDQDGIGLIGSCRHADAPVVLGRLGILKRLEVVRRTSQAEDGGGAHVREGSRNRFMGIAPHQVTIAIFSCLPTLKANFTGGGGVSTIRGSFVTSF